MFVVLVVPSVVVVLPVVLFVVPVDLVVFVVLVVPVVEAVVALSVWVVPVVCVFESAETCSSAETVRVNERSASDEAMQAATNKFLFFMS